jgi:4-amino-4-deoxy-L-arabinose transferase-like glycosyltransferase
MSRRAFLLALLLVFAAAALMRTLWLRADPPAQSPIGIVWHDEGAWVHNARNQALWGVWRTDNWNPVFIAPVFTALEYGAFATWGVGTWQARTVPVVSGLAAVACLVLGLGALAGRRAAAIGALLLATNYVFVMWNRAALMESTMTAFMVAAWAAYALSDKRPSWAFAAGIGAVLAWFTKASAAFFVGALALDAIVTLIQGRLKPASPSGGGPASPETRAAVWTLAGLAAGAAVGAALFVIPNWSEYYFYNWEMTVTRKPSYGIRDLIDRASWLPIVQGFFIRMWLVLVGASVAIFATVSRWRSCPPSERLLALWVLIGLAELVVHDAGNERRYVMFIPALIALAALLVSRQGALVPDRLKAAPLSVRLAVAPLLVVLGYLVIGSALRPVFLTEILAGDFRAAVRVSAVLAVLLTGAIVAAWPRVMAALGRVRLSGGLVTGAIAISIGADLYQYAGWARHRNELNYRASVEVGRMLAAETLVQGKLANGLSLENRIRPIFVGRGFGNYDDRLRRDDIRYLLTYTLPRLGYDSQDGLIQEILDRYPQRREVATFEVDETPREDRAALFDKLPGAAAQQGQNK